MEQKTIDNNTPVFIEYPKSPFLPARECPGYKTMLNPTILKSSPLIKKYNNPNKIFKPTMTDIILLHTNDYDCNFRRVFFASGIVEDVEEQDVIVIDGKENRHEATLYFWANHRGDIFKKDDIEKRKDYIEFLKDDNEGHKAMKKFNAYLLNANNENIEELFESQDDTE